MKYLLLAALLAGLVLPGSATSAEDTLGEVPELSSGKRQASSTSRAIIRSTRRWIGSRIFCNPNKSPCLR